MPVTRDANIQKPHRAKSKEEYSSLHQRKTLTTHPSQPSNSSPYLGSFPFAKKLCLRESGLQPIYLRLKLGNSSHYCGKLMIKLYQELHAHVGHHIFYLINLLKAFANLMLVIKGGGEGFLVYVSRVGTIEAEKVTGCFLQEAYFLVDLAKAEDASVV